MDEEVAGTVDLKVDRSEIKFNGPGCFAPPASPGLKESDGCSDFCEGSDLGRCSAVGVGVTLTVATPCSICKRLSLPKPLAELANFFLALALDLLIPRRVLRHELHALSGGLR